ncbi:MAG TPA: CBS domain-containing protein [Pyrinomonadaceae bacterium]|nr:CBS domain-containing protein [Pyrinomonadaceae bacterium]
MSRNRYDRDDERDFYGGGSSRERSGGGGGGGEDRPGHRQERGNYGRGSGPLDRDPGPDDYYGARRSGPPAAGGRSHGRDDYGRGGGYYDRPDNRYDERRYGNYPGRNAGRGGVGGGGGGRREDDRDDASRSWFEEARDYVRDSRPEERGRGATRSHVRCRDIMTRDVTVATRDTTLQEVAAMMRDEDTGVIPVVERAQQAEAADAEAGNERVDAKTRGNGKLVGLITDRDIVIRAVAEGNDTRATRAEEVMTTDIHTAQPNDRVIDAIRKMGDKQVRRIPVVDNNENLLGIISMADVALETEEDRELADALEEISSGASFWSKIFG